MAQYDYNPSGSPAQQQELKAPRFSKEEEKSLPKFTKDVPLRTIIKKMGRSVMIEYDWDMLGGEVIKIKFSKFRNDSNLANVHKIKITDGAEVGSFQIADSTYIIRKTSEDVAKELMKTTGKIKASILEVIGYFKTVKGNIYTVSKVDSDSWALDQRLGLRTFSLSRMKEGEKRKLYDLVIEEMLRLYQKGYALANFSLMDIIIAKKKIVFGNSAALVKVGATRKVDNFIANLKVMVKDGLAGKGDVVYGIVLSFGVMKKEYSEWVKENGVEGKEEVQVLEHIEKDVFN